MPVLNVDFSAACKLLRAFDRFRLSGNNCARPLGVRFLNGPLIALLYDKNIFVLVLRHKTILPVFVGSCWGASQMRDRFWI